ncbi:fimbrial biogenesis chaperone [Leclercia tamurae]|uniref:Molecular chaperone n=1 Tax=Leclercia tamurae TaxID=2926467 RepID=A0ABT2RC72_9ENTR|nr:molecular chaperone [Leclercia tamurae]MCU6678492.1 molecular chaperone [Leclercia tamurae]
MRSISQLSIILSLFLISAFASAGVQIGTTRIIFIEGKKEASVSLDNQDSTPYLIKSWAENDKIAGSHFMVTPPLFRLEGKQKNVVRIFKLDGALPADRESLFFFNTTAIPASTEDTSRNTLQIAVRTKLKLIFRPKALKDEMPVNYAGKLTWQKKNNAITVSNPSPYYINFMSVKVNNLPVELKETNYVAPFSSTTYELNNAKMGSGKIEWIAINDFGGQSDTYQSTL